MTARTTTPPKLKRVSAKRAPTATRRSATSESASQEGPRVGVQSLGRAFAILETVARQREGIGLADLSRAVGLHNSTTFHLAKSLLALGYVRQDAKTKRYRVGQPLFALAAGALDEIEKVNLATPELEALSRTTGESSHFCLRIGDAIVVVARTSGNSAFQMADRVGVVRPAHCTALGKAILASFDEVQLQRFFDHNPLAPSTKRSITDVAVLQRELAQIRRTGVAYDNGEFDLEVRCAAAAVRDFSGRVIGAIGVSGPVWRITDAALQKQAKAVTGAAARLSASFGHRPPVATSAK